MSSPTSPSGVLQRREPRTTAEAICIVRDLRASMGGRIILEDISFELGGGDVIAVRGASGSGKTTLLSCIAGLEPFDSGTVHVDGVPVHERRSRQLRALRRHSIGMLFQNYGLVGEWTVEENLLVVEAVRRQPKWARTDAMIAALARFDLGERELESRANALSGGEQQRVALAMLDLQRPSLLIADEPSSALDDESCGRLVRFLEDRREMGLGSIVATHDARLLDRFPQVLDLGRA